MLKQETRSKTAGSEAKQAGHILPPGALTPRGESTPVRGRSVLGYRVPWPTELEGVTRTPQHQVTIICREQCALAVTTRRETGLQVCDHEHRHRSDKPKDGKRSPAQA